MVFSFANSRRYLLLTAALILAASSCQKEPFTKRGSRTKIVPVVRSVSTKAQESPATGQLLSERVVSSSDGFDLIEMVYDNIPSSYDGTKGAVVTLGTIEGTGFTMDAYAEDEWHDNTKELGQSGAVDNPYDAGLYFSKTVSYAGSGWSIAGDPTWLNNVPISFWSWNTVQPQHTDGDDFNEVGFELTVDSDVADQIDPIFAYNHETREFDANGEMTGGKDENISIDFFHALSAVQFLKGEVNSRYRISGITLKQVNSHVACTLEGGSDGSIGFTHNSDTPADFQLSFSAGTGPADAADPVAFDTGDANTFFMIPQTLGGDKRLQVEFTNTVDTGNDTTSPVFNLTGEWEAGKYYIYKIKFQGGVTVDIEEIVSGSSKSEVKFRNTSNVNEFIRAAVVANWYDNDGNIVAPWNGTLPINSTSWTSGSDGFYYYNSVVPTKDVTTNLLSSTFNVPTPAPVSGAHFEMTILVQAVCSDGFGGINGPSAFAL